MRHAPSLFVLPIVATLSAALLAQAQFRTETTIVQVDVVVRDAEGRPVDDLDRAAFEVLENGIAQPIVWFERSVGATSTSSHGLGGEADAAGPVAWNQTRHVGTPQSLVALVFHELDQQSRAEAWRAANAMVDRLPPGDYAAVYVIDQTMTPLTHFTRSRETLRRALRTMAMTPPARPVSMAGVAESGGPSMPGSPSDQEAVAMRSRMAAGAEGHYDAGAQGAAFSQLVAELDRFPGRRAVFLFSEGLAMPMVAPRLEAVAGEAAPRHVSFYTLDPGGLRRSGRRQQSVSRIDRGQLTSVSTETAWRLAKVSEMDASLGLRPLAELTGGLYLADSNDLGALLGRANADRRSFYVLGYRTSAPTAEAGTRPIEVRVARPGLRVRARTRTGQTQPTSSQPPAYERRTR